LREIEAEFAHRDPSVRFLLDLSAAKDAEIEQLGTVLWHVRLLVATWDHLHPDENGSDAVALIDSVLAPPDKEGTR
jgi:hypothetical protein